MRIGEYDCEAMLLNASSTGVLAAMASPPARGTRVTLIVGDMTLRGQVRWHGVDCCGIALRDPISVADLLDGHTISVMLVPQPRGLRGLSGMLRLLVSERTLLDRFS
jgi:hypothetical protein